MLQPRQQCSIGDTTVRFQKPSGLRVVSQARVKEAGERGVLHCSGRGNEGWDVLYHCNIVRRPILQPGGGHEMKRGETTKPMDWDMERSPGSPHAGDAMSLAPVDILLKPDGTTLVLSMPSNHSQVCRGAARWHCQRVS
jgi:hypothetical protein